MRFFCFLSLLLTLAACQTDSQWAGQAPVRKVQTETLPVQHQHKGTFSLEQGIYASNDFPGGRLNGIVQRNDTLLALITAENTPINPSPWYAFQLWSETAQSIQLKLTYPPQEYHRYYPKLSADGLNWTPVDSSAYQEALVTLPGETNQQRPKSVTLSLDIGPDTLWIAAQELMASPQVKSWSNELDSLHPFISQSVVGQSREGADLGLLTLGNPEAEKMILLISRQHPPEVTGYLSLQPFVETLCGNTEQARQFRNEYVTYVVPLMNPDGVDRGHWRHSYGGIDLNRDWEDFNQPETAAIRNFLEQKIETEGRTLYLGMDFHSTYNDIYYTFTKNPDRKIAKPGLVMDMIEQSAQPFPDYEPNISPRDESESRVTSAAYFVDTYGAESLVFEIGDNTPRPFVEEKARATAETLMKLLLEETTGN